MRDPARIRGILEADKGSLFADIGSSFAVEARTPALTPGAPATRLPGESDRPSIARVESWPVVRRKAIDEEIAAVEHRHVGERSISMRTNPLENNPQRCPKCPAGTLRRIGRGDDRGRQDSARTVTQWQCDECRFETSEFQLRLARRHSRTVIC